MNFLLVSVTAIGFVFAAIILAAFFRALTARLATGKWPHQSEQAQRIYRNLP